MEYHLMMYSQNSKGGGSKSARTPKRAQPTSFAERVYAVVSTIPSGEVRTYRWVAEKAGKPRAYRAVGQILKRNPNLGKVPCHRVIRSDGKLGGYVRGTAEKISKLRAEGFLQYGPFSLTL